MAVTLKQIQVLQDKIKDLTAEKDRAKGREETLMEQLKKDFKCTTLAQAKKLLKKRKKKLATMEEEMDRAYKDFLEEHEELLDEKPF